MTFKEIYHRILPLWGEIIDFSDGMLIESKNSLKTLGGTPTTTTNLYSEELSSRWGGVEEAVGQEDTYGKLMVWTMYEVFHRQASILFEQGIFSLDPGSIDKSEIEEQYFRNLQDESWEEELSQYQRIVE